MVVPSRKLIARPTAVTVAAASGDTIEGNTFVIQKKQYDSLQLLSNNSNSGHEWYILQSAKCGALLT